MDLLTIAATICPIILGYISYNQSQIRKLNERMNNVPTKQEMQKDIDTKMEYIKEKIEDNFSPLQSQLNRLENRLNKVLEILDKE